MIGDVLGCRARWLRNLPARTALKLCNQRQIRKILGKRHDDALREHVRKLPKLGSLDATIAEALNRDGIFLASAEEADVPAWRLQALAAARAEHAEASAWLGVTGERLVGLAPGGDLPALLDPLPARVDALRSELQAAEERLLQLAARARPVGRT